MPPLSSLLLVLSVWLAAAALPCAASPTPGAVNTTALIQTAWGGGVSGNAPGNINGGLDVASLASAGSTAWMGSSHFDLYTSNFYTVDSGHPTSIKVYNPLNSSGLSTYLSSVPSSPCSGSQVLKAVLIDNSSGLWVIDCGCGNVQFRSAVGVWTTALSLSIDPTKPASLVSIRDSSYLFASVSTSIIYINRGIIDCVKAASGGCGIYNVTLVKTVAASNISLSFDERWLYYIETGAINAVNLTLPLTSYPTTPTTLVTTGSGLPIINPTAMAVSPDGLGLVIADYLPAGYSRIKYLNFSSLTVVTIGPNNVQSNCGNCSNTYQNGYIGGPACFGLIQQIITGTGTQGNQLFFFEVNTGRVRALDWSTQLMRTVIGGGASNDGFSHPANTPMGWAKGFGKESSFDTNLTGLAWDTTRNIGYVAEQVNPHPPTHATHIHRAALYHHSAPALLLTCGCCCCCGGCCVVLCRVTVLFAV